MQRLLIPLCAHGSHCLRRTSGKTRQPGSRPTTQPEHALPGTSAVYGDPLLARKYRARQNSLAPSETPTGIVQSPQFTVAYAEAGLPTASTYHPTGIGRTISAGYGKYPVQVNLLPICTRSLLLPTIAPHQALPSSLFHPALAVTC